MKIDKTRLCAIAVVAMVASLFSISYPGWNATGEAVAASAQDKTQARQSLNEVISLLRGVDTAYASGNSPSMPLTVAFTLVAGPPLLSWLPRESNSNCASRASRAEISGEILFQLARA